MVWVVGHVEAMLLYRPVQRDVLGSLPGPGDHKFLRELILVQLLLAFCGQNAVNEGEGVTVAVVVFFFVPSKQGHGEGLALKAAQEQAAKLLKAFHNWNRALSASWAQPGQGRWASWASADCSLNAEETT